MKKGIFASQCTTFMGWYKCSAEFSVCKIVYEMVDVKLELVSFQGSLSNTEYLTFNLTSLETSSEVQAIGVISRNVVSIDKKKFTSL